MKKLLLNIIPIITVCFLFLTLGYFLGKRNANALPLHPSSEQTAENLSSTPQKVIDWKININSATLEELLYVPGLGKVLAQRILEYREMNGPFKSINELDNVAGFGKSRIEQLSQYITAGG